VGRRHGLPPGDRAHHHLTLDEQGIVRYEPDIDRDKLVRAIGAAYGVTVSDLHFIPVGFAAACYRLQAGNTALFLKLWPGCLEHSRPQLVTRRNRGLRLARALYVLGIYPRVAYPLLTGRDGLTAAYAGGEFAVFPFLEGAAPPAVWPVALQDEWARTLALIHRATPSLADVLPERERFEFGFEADLRRGLNLLASLGPDARPGLSRAQRLLQAGQRDIDAQVARLVDLRHAVRRLGSPFVLCHTDMGGDNLLVDDAGRLYVLDWDEATVAPPEHDLHEARWIGLERILRTYREAGGAAPLHLDHFAFYILRRALGDMTARFTRILTINATDEEDDDAIFGIEEWGFRQWAALDETLAGIAEALA
jgi:aminoglycoside phosphotransferase (APT) family kinase protein